MKFVNFHSRQYAVPVQKRLLKPTKQALIKAPPLRSRSNKPLAMDTEELLNILTYYHLQEFSSSRELIQALQEDDYAKNLVAPAGGIKRSTFFDTVNDRGVEQLLHVFTELQKQVPGTCRRSILIWLISLLLTDLSLIQFFQCTGQNIVPIPKKQNSILALISTMEFHINCS